MSTAGAFVREVKVEIVPLPAGLPLDLTGLAALVAVRRRKRPARAEG